MLHNNRLRLLVELQNRGSISAVAHTLNYDPSAVSHQLRILGQEVGSPVIEPFGRGVRLTDTGEILARYGREVMHLLDEAEAAVAAAMTEPHGVVRIATFASAAHTFVLDAVVAVKQIQPLLDLRVTHLRAEDAVQTLGTRDFDIAVIEEFPQNPAPIAPRTQAQPVLDDPMHLAFHRALEADASVSLTTLAQEPWAMEPEGTPARAWAVAMCRTAGFEPRVAFESADPFLHARIVASGAAAAFLPGMVLRGHDDGIHAMQLHGAQRRISLITRSAAEPNPSIRYAAEALAKTASAYRTSHASA